MPGDTRLSKPRPSIVSFQGTKVAVPLQTDRRIC